MGKPKKGKKNQADEDFGDDDIDVDPKAHIEEGSTTKSVPVAKKTKKKGKKKDDDWDDDVAAEIAMLSLEHGQGDDDPEDTEVNGQQRPKKKEKKKTRKTVVESDEDDDSLAANDNRMNKSKKVTGLSAFAMLDMDEDSDDKDSESEEESVKQSIPVKQDSVEKLGDVEPKQKKGKKDKKKQKNKDDHEEDLDAILAELDTDKNVKGKQDKKKKGKKNQDEEDIDALVANLDDAKPKSKKGKKKISEQVEYVEEDTGGLDFEDAASMTPDEIAKAMGEDEDSDDDRKKEKKNKNAKTDVDKEENMELFEDMEDEDDEGGTVKTAAQKKKEKKERQKQKKLEEKGKPKKKESKPQTDTKQEEDMEIEADEAKANENEGLNKPEASAQEGVDVEDEGESKKKKKDRRKKKGEKEEEKETKKKPSKMAKVLAERLQKMKEEEERFKLEEDEKHRKIDEAIRLKEEKERLEHERKEAIKQKKRDKIQKKKEEGTYLTAKQKEAQRRAQQMLEAMKAQGIELPQAPAEVEKKKKVVYEKKKKRPQNKEEVVESHASASPTEEMKTDANEEVEVENTPKEEPQEPKDNWEDEDNTKDAWDVESDDEAKSEKKTKKIEVEVKKVTQEDIKKEEESSEDESEEEGSEEESSEEESSEEESDDDLTAQEKAREKAVARIQKRHEDAEKKRNTDTLRCPVVCVLGHVDTGKTKILDKLRRTNVQDGEAGGITQQIGATNVPREAIVEKTKMCKEFTKKELKLPGLLIIDTPGHESFSNLRTRGSSLCDIAILVIDIMHGLEPQTIESINLLKAKRTPFIIALNKIDRLYQWQSNPHSDIQNTLKKQKQNTKQEFDERIQQVIVQLAEQSLNACLFFDNKNPKEYFSMVPTSAHSGDGMGNLVALICEFSQQYLAKKISYSEELEATVMEVKSIQGLGTTIDVILVNGCLKEAQAIIVAGTEGPIVTTIRGLLMPEPMKELRVKNAYNHHKEVEAAQGIKIIAKDLDTALAGLPLRVAYHPDEVEVHKEELAEALEEVLKSIRVQERGVFVQASTLGSLEALLQFLKDSKIPYCGINIGPVHRKDVMKASVMLEHDEQYACILAFDVKIEREAQEMAESLGIRLFTAEIIYHLFDQFTAYRDEYKKKKQEEFKHLAIFPCKLRVLPQYIFNSRDPIVMGVIVDAGFIKNGQPICVPSKEFLRIGIVTSLEINHKPVEKGLKGQEVCIKIEPFPGEAPKMYGRHFEHTDTLMTKISRESIDAVKNYFRDEMKKEDWQLVMEMKKIFEIL